MINVDQWAEIRRLHRVEGMSIRGISQHLGVARKTVARALRTEEAPKYRRAREPSKLDPFKARIGDLLAEYPRLSAVRVHEIISGEGFQGGVTIVRVHLRQVRPQPIAAFQRTVYQPGEIGQVDWAQMPDRIPDAYGKLRPVYALVMVLGYSRLLTVVERRAGFSFRTRLVDFLRCHAEALAFFGGVPHTIVYDNLKSVVLKRRGAEVIFNPQFLPFADRYGFRPWPTWPGEPHEKGLIERPIHYIKNNFWAGRKFASMEDLQEQGIRWRDNTCNVRIHNGLDETAESTASNWNGHISCPSLQNLTKRRRSCLPGPAVGATCAWMAMITRFPCFWLEEGWEPNSMPALSGSMTRAGSWRSMPGASATMR